jgi:hypothetical protein
MTNLLEETVRKLTENDKSPDDVRWVGNDKIEITWEQFAKLADNTYDSGFGRQEVAEDLVVVGDDFWLERHEYDGFEWWEYKTLPRTTGEFREIDVTDIIYGDEY